VWAELADGMKEEGGVRRQTAKFDLRRYQIEGEKRSLQYRLPSQTHGEEG